MNVALNISRLHVIVVARGSHSDERSAVFAVGYTQCNIYEVNCLYSSDRHIIIDYFAFSFL